MSTNQNAPAFGALVISLDFELHWGVRDKRPVDGPYRENLLGAREAIPRMLDLFEEFGVAATWATVGFLFAKNRREREEFSPSIRPQYKNPKLDAYAETTGDNEDDDPIHYASSLIARIAKTPKQEIATHTFSHYYCQESRRNARSIRRRYRQRHRNRPPQWFRHPLHRLSTQSVPHGVRIRTEGRRNHLLPRQRTKLDVPPASP